VYSSDSAIDAICSVREQGALSEVLWGLASEIGPLPDPSQCTGLGEFILSKEPLVSSLPPEIQSQVRSGNYVHGGLIGSLAYYDSIVYDNPPASSVHYATYLAEKIGAVPAYAQQVSGADMFRPVIIIWQKARDISLTFMVIVMILLAFSILIRRKTSSEIVSPINSLVGLGVSLILIVFSYPITAFIVDIGTNVGNRFVASLLNPYINAKDLLEGLYTPGSGYNIIDMVVDIQAIGVGGTLVSIVEKIVGSSMPILSEDIQNFFGGLSRGGNMIGGLIGAIGTFFSWIITGIISQVLAATLSKEAGGSLFTLIASFVLFFVNVRVTFALFIAYVSLAAKVAISPFAFVGTAFPGGFNGIWNWVKTVLADALVFPTVFAGILLAAIFLNLRMSVLPDQCKTLRVAGSTGDRSFFFDATPYNGDDCYPALLPPRFNYLPAPIGYIQGTNADAVARTIIAVGILLVTPSAGGMWKEILGVKEFRFFQAIGASIRAGLGGFAAYMERIPSLGFGRGIAGLARTMGGSF